MGGAMAAKVVHAVICKIKQSPALGLEGIGLGCWSGNTRVVFLHSCHNFMNVSCANKANSTCLVTRDLFSNPI